MNTCYALHTSKHFVFDLTGSRHAYGDVIGPLWTMMDLKRHYLSSKSRGDGQCFGAPRFSVLIDPRAEQIITELHPDLRFSSLPDELQIECVRRNDIHTTLPANYLFQLFHEGRNLCEFSKYPFVTSETVTILSDTMHGKKLDEIWMEGRHFYFKPPGLGSYRSGIVSNPAVGEFQSKSKRIRKEALSILFNQKFPDSPLTDRFFSESNISSNVKYAFMYGAHNEIFSSQLIGQSREYVEALARLSLGNSPVIVFSPNTEAELRKALGGTSPHLYHLIGRVEREDSENSDFLSLFLGQFENKVYIVSLPNISNRLFTGLMSVSDFPVLVEGDGSLSTALQLRVPFVLYRSLWNAPQLHEVMQLEKATVGSSFYEKTYTSKQLAPGAIHELTVQLAQLESEGNSLLTRGESIVQAMSERTPAHSIALANLVDTLERFRGLRNRHGSSLKHPTKHAAESSANYAAKLSQFTEDLLQSGRDELLAYSIAHDTHQRGELDDFSLRQLAKKMRKLGYSIPSLEARLVPYLSQSSQSSRWSRGTSKGFVPSAARTHSN